MGNWLRWLALAGLVGVVLGGLAWQSRPDGRLHLFFLATPGDALLIVAPDGRTVLVDGGADPTGLALHLGERLPFWQRTLTAVVLTGAGERRLPGQVAALTRYRAELALAPAGIAASASAHEWLRLLREAGTPVRIAQPGDQINLGGAMLRVLAVANATGGVEQGPGLALRLDYGATRVLLDGAGSAATLLQRGDQPVAPVTLLAYPWERPLDAPLLAAWQPQAIVFTTAYQQVRPPRQTSYARAGGDRVLHRRLYHPARDGTLELVSNGRVACIRRAGEPPCPVR